MTTIYVTNNWDKSVQMDYCFKQYEFPIGKTVAVEEDAARHIFGFHDLNKEPYMVRLGWQKTRNDFETCLRIYDSFVFSAEPPAKNQSLSPLVEKVPHSVSKRSGGNVPSQQAA